MRLAGAHHVHVSKTFLAQQQRRPGGASQSQMQRPGIRQVRMLHPGRGPGDSQVRVIKRDLIVICLIYQQWIWIRSCRPATPCISHTLATIIHMRSPEHTITITSVCSAGSPGNRSSNRCDAGISYTAAATRHASGSMTNRYVARISKLRQCNQKDRGATAPLSRIAAIKQSAAVLLNDGFACPRVRGPRPRSRSRPRRHARPRARARALRNPRSCARPRHWCRCWYHDHH